MIQLLIAGLIIIAITLGIMLFSHSQSLQRFAVLEFLLVLAVLAASVSGFSRARTFMKEEYFSLFHVYIGEAQAYAYEVEEESRASSAAAWQKIGDEMQAILEKSLPITIRDGQEIRYLTAAAFERTEDGSCLMKVCRQQDEGYLTEKQCLSYAEGMAEKAIRLGSMLYEETEQKTGVLVYTGTGIISPKYVFLVEIPLDPLWQEVSGLLREYAVFGGIFWMAATAALAAVIWLQGRQMRSLVRTAARVAEGKEDWEALQDGMNSLWLESNEIRGLKNSLSQIAADVARMNYVKYKVLQGYYRFAPKQIEQILGRHSILEVEPDDRVSITGTLAFVAYPEDQKIGEAESLKKASREYKVLSEKQKEHGGILLSANSDLTTIQLLFREETKKALHFGIDISMQQPEGEKLECFVLLHRTAFVYGVAGNEEQAFSYVLSREMKRLEKYVARFRSAGIRMAVTDAVYELIEKEAACRYIGYLEEGGCVFKLYEILDACPAKERLRRLNTRDKFERALNLFYQGDYYLGRNLFTEVLKECPEDEVAKGYLFLCEKCLNTDCGKDISCALFSD